MIVVTGGAGFIGSNLIKALNDSGTNDILLVDDLTNEKKSANIQDLDIREQMGKAEFLKQIRKGLLKNSIKVIFHQGACSDTMASDGAYVLHNNYIYSRNLFEFCVLSNVRFIYASSASVYGSGRVFLEDRRYESALNAYAWSKLMFDNFVRRQPDIPIQCAGLRYFNVYGPREAHKGRMASVAWHFYNQYKANGKVNLFSGTDGYSDGEQVRDFVYIEDVIDVNMFLLQNEDISGIFNVGTGKAQAFNDVALSVINCARGEQNRPLRTLQSAVDSGEINYVPLPDALQGKYQSFTQAELGNLLGKGFGDSFDTVSEGVKKYVKSLSSASIVA